MLKIDREFLEDKFACDDGIDEFLEAFPNGITLTNRRSFSRNLNKLCNRFYYEMYDVVQYLGLDDVFVSNLINKNRNKWDALDISDVGPRTQVRVLWAALKKEYPRRLKD